MAPAKFARRYARAFTQPVPRDARPRRTPWCGSPYAPLVQLDDKARCLAASARGSSPSRLAPPRQRPWRLATAVRSLASCAPLGRWEGPDAAPCAAIGGARRRPRQNSQRVLLAIAHAKFARALPVAARHRGARHGIVRTSRAPWCGPVAVGRDVPIAPPRQRRGARLGK